MWKRCESQKNIFRKLAQSFEVVSIRGKKENKKRMNIWAEEKRKNETDGMKSYLKEASERLTTKRYELNMFKSK